MILRLQALCLAVPMVLVGGCDASDSRPVDIVATLPEDRTDIMRAFFSEFGASKTSFLVNESETDLELEEALHVLLVDCADPDCFVGDLATGAGDLERYERLCEKISVLGMRGAGVLVVYSPRDLQSGIQSSLGSCGVSVVFRTLELREAIVQ